MSEYNPNWIKFDGTPVTGQVPTQVFASGPMTEAQAAAVSHVYGAFCQDKLLSIANTHRQEYRLADGTLIEITSIFGVDSISVVPAATAENEVHGIGVLFATLAGGTGEVTGYPRPIILTPSWRVDQASGLPIDTGDWTVTLVTELNGGERLWVDENRKRWLSVRRPAKVVLSRIVQTDAELVEFSALYRGNSIVGWKSKPSFAVPFFVGAKATPIHLSAGWAPEGQVPSLQYRYGLLDTGEGAMTELSTWPPGTARPTTRTPVAPTQTLAVGMYRPIVIGTLTLPVYGAQSIVPDTLIAVDGRAVRSWRPTHFGAVAVHPSGGRAVTTAALPEPVIVELDISAAGQPTVRNIDTSHLYGWHRTEDNQLTAVAAGTVDGLGSRTVSADFNFPAAAYYRSDGTVLVEDIRVESTDSSTSAISEVGVVDYVVDFYVPQGSPPLSLLRSTSTSASSSYRSSRRLADGRTLVSLESQASERAVSEIRIVHSAEFIDSIPGDMSSGRWQFTQTVQSHATSYSSTSSSVSRDILIYDERTGLLVYVECTTESTSDITHDLTGTVVRFTERTRGGNWEGEQVPPVVAGSGTSHTASTTRLIVEDSSGAVCASIVMGSHTEVFAPGGSGYDWFTPDPYPFARAFRSQAPESGSYRSELNLATMGVTHVLEAVRLSRTLFTDATKFVEVSYARDPKTLAAIAQVTYRKSQHIPGEVDLSWMWVVDSKGVRPITDLLTSMGMSVPTDQYASRLVSI